MKTKYYKNLYYLINIKVTESVEIGLNNSFFRSFTYLFSKVGQFSWKQ